MSTGLLLISLLLVLPIVQSGFSSDSPNQTFFQNIRFGKSGTANTLQVPAIPLKQIPSIDLSDRRADPQFLEHAKAKLNKHELLKLPITTATIPHGESENQATDLIQKTSAAAGWAQDWSKKSFLYHASYTPGDGTSGIMSVTVEFSGISKLRSTSQNGDISYTSVANAGQAVVFVDGKPQPVSPDALFSSQAILPFLSDYFATADPTVAYEYLGEDDSVGTKALVVSSLRPPVTAGSLPARGATQISPTKIWLSVDTMLPIQSEAPMSGWDSPHPTIPFLRKYSDYQIISGIAVPFTTAVYSGDTLLFTFTLKDIQFDILLPDSDFSVQ